MAQVGLPLTGSGDATAQVATDQINTEHWQRMKLGDGEEGSTAMGRILSSAPNSTDAGLVTRPIPSSAYNQGVVGEVGITSAGSTKLIGQVTVANPTTAVTVTGTVGLTSGSSAVELTSAGSTRLVGQVTVANPTTAVTVGGTVGITSGSSAVELTSAGSTRSVGTVNQGSPAGTSADAWWVRTVTTGSAGGSTTVDANLTSAGSTRVVGTVNVTSGAVLGGSTAAIGLVAQGSPGGSSADAWWVRTVTTGSAGAGSTTVDANLSSAGSTRTVGVVGQGPGSSAAYWLYQTLGFTSALTSRTTANTSAEAAVVAASTAVLGMLIQNMTTVDVGLALSTAAPTTAFANIAIVLSGRNVAGGGSRVAFGYDLPNFTGNVRGKTIGSTAVAGGVVVTRFLSS